jgi:hypothetical protein
VLGRAVCKLQVGGHNLQIQFKDPTAVALASLIAAFPFSGPMLDSILKYRGVDILLRLLSKSTCRLILGLTSDLIRKLMSGSGRTGQLERRQEFADAFFISGR